jgi:DNA-binding CsgD family transcriptional regulator
VISAPIRFTTFAGRSSELEHLLACRADAAKGRGGCVLVAGDPGIGKSRLLREFVAHVPRRSTKIVTSAYREFAQRPLAPLLEIVRALGLGSHLEEGSYADKAAFTADIVAAFEQAADARTTVVVLEDLHWADREALGILHALTVVASRKRLLFVATYRPAEIGTSHPNFSLLGRLLREEVVSLVTLESLASHELAELMRGALEGRTRLPGPLLDDLRRRSDGNPFFAEELLRYAVDRVAAGHDVQLDSVPLSVHAAIRERIELCSSAGRALLTHASLFGRRFDPALVEATLEDSAQKIGDETALEELQRLGLIERAGDDVRFRHALLRETAYAEIGPLEARVAHRRIAEVLAARSAGSSVESIAHHFWHAGDRERAAPYCKAAGDAARAIFAYDDASDWYERAATAFAATDDGTSDDGARALVAAAQTAGLADRIERALAIYPRVAETYAREGRTDDVIVANVLAAATLYDHGRASDAAMLLESTRERWSATASPLVRDRLLLRLGFLYAFVRRADAAWACLDAIGETALEPPTIVAAEREFLRSALHAQSARRDEWQATFDRGFDLFERAGAIADNRRIALSNAALQAVALGDIEAARRYQTRALDVANAIRSNVDHERVLLAQIDVQAGRPALARAAFETALPADRFAARAERAILGAWLAQLYGDDVHDETDRRLLAEAEAGGDSRAFARIACALGTLALRDGREREADAYFERAAERIDSPFGMTFAIAALALARPAYASRVRTLVALAAERPGDRVARALLDLIDAANERHADANATASVARRAANAFDDIGWPWLAAQVRELVGDLDEALRYYAQVGAMAGVRRLERASRVRGSTTPHGSVLTPRERELARIVAHGAANRTVARRLEISEKAVEKHLTSIYAKLGITSRAQLAAHFAGGGEQTIATTNGRVL